MKYLIVIFCSFLFAFALFAGLLIYKSLDGSLDTCIYKFADCVLEGDGKKRIIKTFSCSNKTLVCNIKSLYYSFFNEDTLDKEYNDYMYDKINKEIEAEEKLDNQQNEKTNNDILEEDKEGYNIDVDI